MDAHRKTVLLFMVVAFVMTACPTGVRAACCCPSLWTAFGQNCYRFFSDNLTWQEAENHCKSFSVPSLGDGGEVRDSLGHLVSIHSEAENNFVSTLFRSSYKKEGGPGHFATWIGLHDVSTEDHFEWTDGTPLDYQLWRPGEPNNGRGSGQDCGTLSVNYGYKWDDDMCTKTMYDFVCKLPSL